MSAPVYEISGKFIRVCWDGWMFELSNPTAHNYEGRELPRNEREEVSRAISDGTARKLN